MWEPLTCHPGDGVWFLGFLPKKNALGCATIDNLGPGKGIRPWENHELQKIGSRGHKAPWRRSRRRSLLVRRRPGGDCPPACAFALIYEVEQKDISANLLFFVYLDAIKDGVGVREIGHVKVADLAEQG